MIYALIIGYFALTNHFMRGITFGETKWVGGVLKTKDFKDQPWYYQILQIVTGKYAWSVYSGLILGVVGIMQNNEFNYMYALVGAVGLTIWAAPGANFDGIAQIDGDSKLTNFLQALKRGLWIMPLMITIVIMPSSHAHLGMGIAAGFFSAFIYAFVPWCIHFVYHKKATWAVMVNETAIGALGLGLPIAYLIGG